MISKCTVSPLVWPTRPTVGSPAPLDATPSRDLLSDHQHESMLRSMDNAYRLLSAKERSAFDITLETPEVQKDYDTGRFGRGCLLARRLVENGGSLKEVADVLRHRSLETSRIYAKLDTPNLADVALPWPGSES